MSAETFPSLNPPVWPTRLTRVGLWMIGAGLVLAVLSGPFNRLQVVGFAPALLMLAVGSLVLVVGALLAIVGFITATRRRLVVARGPTVLAIVVALAVTGYLLTWLVQARASAPIHEVSTDLESPPEFVAVRELRAGEPGVNPSEYVARIQGRSGTIDVPAMQRRHYPDLQPLELPLSRAEAMVRSRRAAEALGWKIVAYVPAEGRLEATDSTAFFGFKDDIVVRVRSTETGSRIDVRSKSRVGLGDLGKNAARVRSFLERVRGE